MTSENPGLASTQCRALPDRAVISNAMPCLLLPALPPAVLECRDRPPHLQAKQNLMLICACAPGSHLSSWPAASLLRPLDCMDVRVLASHMRRLDVGIVLALLQALCAREAWQRGRDCGLRALQVLHTLQGRAQRACSAIALGLHRGHGHARMHATCRRNWSSHRISGIVIAGGPCMPESTLGVLLRPG